MHFPVVRYDVLVSKRSCPHVCYDRLFCPILLTFKDSELQSNYIKLIVLSSQTFTYIDHRRQPTAVKYTSTT